MRVVYSFPHRIGSPGIGTIAAQQVLGLVESGHEVVVYCMSAGCSMPGVRSTVQTMAVGRYRVPRKAVGFERALRYHDRRTARSVARSHADADAVHVWGLAAVQTLRIAKRLGIHSFREVPNAHTEFAYQRASQEAAALRVEVPRHHSHRPNPGRLARERAEFSLADTLLVPSDFVLQTFLDRGFDPAQLARHRYGFDPHQFPAPPVEGPSTGGKPLRACFVGLGEPRKGLHHALRAWAESGVAETGRLVVCGNILPDYRRKLSPLLGHPSVSTPGFVSDVGAVMRQSDILMLPSVEEGSALVTYEALASGCALLVSDAAGAPCRHPDQGLIHPAGDVAALTEHLRMLDQDRLLLARLRATGLARRQELTWVAAAARLDAIYKDRTGSQGRR